MFFPPDTGETTCDTSNQQSDDTRPDIATHHNLEDTRPQQHNTNLTSPCWVNHGQLRIPAMMTYVPFVQYRKFNLLT